ncbi:MAG: hypothetical protein H0T71_10710, partial [Acidobacteria bacterium]|nr:hypothetical protein [Acidobacteriota bacterium]
APGDAAKALTELEVTDFEGLRSQNLLEKALGLRTKDPEELPAALMEKLSDGEAQLLSQVAAAAQSPSLDLHACVQVLRYSRVERQLAAIQREIDRGGREEHTKAGLSQLLRQKNQLRSQLELARRGPRDLYNK